MADRVLAFKRFLSENGALIAAFTCFWAFHYIVFWSDSFAVIEPEVDFNLGGEVVWLIALLCNVFSLALFLLFLRRVQRVDFRKLSKISSALCTCGIALIALRVHWVGLCWGLAYLFGTSLLGVGTGLLMACFANVFFDKTPQVMLASISMSFVLASVVCLVTTSAFVPIAAQIVTSMFPLAVAFLYERALDGKDRQNSPANSAFNTGGSPSPASLLFLVAVFGFTVGIMRGTNAVASTPSTVGRLFSLTVLMTGLCLLVLSSRADRVKPNLLLLVIVVVVSGAFVILGLFPYDSIIVAFVVYTVGFTCFVALVWFFCTCFSNRKKDGAIGFIAGLLANQAGQAIGSALCFAVIMAFGLPDRLLLCLSVGTVYALLVVALFFFASAKRGRRSNLTGPSEAEALEALRALSGQYSLTPREVEIGAFIATGATRSAIASRLTLSEETVKTHTKNLYRKLSVHSGDELGEIVRRKVAESVFV